jgi:hypothetical protein
MTLGQFFDRVEQEAARDIGQSAQLRAKRATVRRWLGEVITCPDGWQDRVAAVPQGQGVDYALALIKAATGKALRFEPAPPPVARNIPLI